MNTKRNTLVGPQLQARRLDVNPDWKRLIGFLGAITLGSIVATQVLAHSYGFHPLLGFNMFHVYPPWSYFVWSHQWEQPINHALFAQAFGIGSMVTLGGFVLLLLDGSSLTRDLYQEKTEKEQKNKKLRQRGAL
jgi:type IV secretion system protein VirD4